MAIVYVHKKKTDDSIFYIGIGERESRAKKAAGRSKMWKDVSSAHGWYWQILFNDVTIEEAKRIEIYLIRYYGKRIENMGELVNITDGGDGVFGARHTEEHKKRISSLHKGKVLSEETKRKISDAHKGKKHKEQSKLKMRLAKIGTVPHNKGKKTNKPSNNAKEVILFDKEGIQVECFPNTYKAAEYVELSQSIVFKNCKHLKKMRDGRYFRYK